MAKTVLIAEAKKHVLDKACQILKSGGYEVITSENGTEALEKTSNADVVLADYLLPEKSGLGIVFELKQKGVNKPVVIMSDASFVTDESIRKSGGNGFVKKPLNPEELLSTVNKLMAG